MRCAETVNLWYVVKISKSMRVTEGEVCRDSQPMVCGKDLQEHESD